MSRHENAVQGRMEQAEYAGDVAHHASEIVRRSIPRTLARMSYLQLQEAIEYIEEAVAEAVCYNPDDIEPYDLTEITLLAIEAVTTYTFDGHCTCFSMPDAEECICLDIAKNELGVTR